MIAHYDCCAHARSRRKGPVCSPGKGAVKMERTGDQKMVTFLIRGPLDRATCNLGAKC